MARSLAQSILDSDAGFSPYRRVAPGLASSSSSMRARTVPRTSLVSNLGLWATITSTACSTTPASLSMV